MSELQSLVKCFIDLTELSSLVVYQVVLNQIVSLVGRIVRGQVVG